MAFTPIALPIQEILLTNFVTDIATISNANDLILQDKLQDLINNFEIDLNTLSIGTDNPINYVRTQTLIIQDTGLIFQTGSPAQIIAKLEKNTNSKSVLTVDYLNINSSIASDSISTNAIVVNDSLTVDGPSVINSSFETKAATISSKEAITLDLTYSGSGDEATATLNLTNSSRKNIFIKLKASTAPTLNPVYDGAGSFTAGIGKIVVYINFDASNPPAQNTEFKIYLVDVVDEVLGASILTSAVNGGLIPTIIRGGQNLNAAPVAPVYLHNNLGPATYDVGINPNTVTVDTSSVLKSDTFSRYGHNISLLYILDENSNDRLVITALTGMEFFNS
jgi:hypothetical protein